MQVRAKHAQVCEKHTMENDESVNSDNNVWRSNARERYCQNTLSIFGTYILIHRVEIYKLVFK
jgi:hypothetical protein